MNNLQSELSLRDMIEIIWRNKWIIIGSTALAILVAGIISFFILSPVYQATSIIRVGNEAEGNTQHLNSISESIKSDVIISRVLDHLNLHEDFTIDQLRNNLKVDVVRNTSVMKVTHSGKDPSITAQIVNLIAYEMSMRVEVTDLANKIQKAKERSLDLEQRIAVAMKEYETISELLRETPEKQVTRQTLSRHPYLMTILEEITGLSSAEIGELQFENESINPLYNALQAKLSEVSIELASMGKERENLVTLISELEQRIWELENGDHGYNLTPQGFQKVINGLNTVFISPASKPEEPVRPRKLVNLLIGSLIGCIMGLLIAFIKHFWNVDRRNERSSSTNSTYQM